jgi:P-type Cu+ transporter
VSRATNAEHPREPVLAFVYNALGAPSSLTVLYPVFGTLLSPIVASAAMTSSSVSVTGNAPRLRRLQELDLEAR